MNGEYAAYARRSACEEFLYNEAYLLDDRRVFEWFDLVTEDIDYRVPVRTTRERSADEEFSDQAYHLKEDHESLRVRIERLENDFAWSENPPSRTRRFVSNVTVLDADDDSFDVRSNLLVHRSHEDSTTPDLLSAERRDTLRRTEDGLGLAARLVLLDHTVLPTDSLSIIL
ncbi:aromatic-ring-hydroxylating dioxygenase subunit beta [Halocatena salina]|uniref:Aromatic-ring-hydroxylating dioxygenase subunit beta n=1 Tax=Halocatena salina TaxID=2934340 RepID=A0A8U0A621_9EURY|nr:aromatic-ring-hydroxylating dioxygenase subunit beta [Halocatena salina]UPM44326.1 aromatic-ring-hydroxylating dioxygenase subunit beta [Halocatena salina]